MRKGSALGQLAQFLSCELKIAQGKQALPLSSDPVAQASEFRRKIRIPYLQLNPNDCRRDPTQIQCSRLGQCAFDI
jgi:hypothetical protein